MSLFRHLSKAKGIILVSLLLVTLVSACSPGRNLDSQLRKIAGRYYFSITGWEITAIPQVIKPDALIKPTDSDQPEIVLQYFARARQLSALDTTIEQARTHQQIALLPALEAERDQLESQNQVSVDTVERIIAQQVRETLSAESIYNPWFDVEIGFPPLNFTVERLPFLLVVSPRDRIGPLRKIMLNSNLTLTQRETIEENVDKLGVSSLVSDIGGLGATYPTLVSNKESLPDTITAAAHEWLHQYLAFKPLGLLYILDLTGIRRDYDVATMNETLASVVSEEIGALVYQKYYAKYENPAPTPNSPPQPAFDFNSTMRQIRKTTDSLLSEGKIDEAEQYMDQQRDYLETRGYYIRKLNQAYFAFHGTYAESPASSSPIGAEMQQLRAQSPSLKAFLDKAAAMTNPKTLERSLK